MTSCTFMQCTNNSKKNQKKEGVTFHTFPGNEIWKSKWIKIVREERKDPDWTPTKYSRVCSFHFKPEHMYTTSKGRRKITQGAIPYFEANMKAANYATISTPGTHKSLGNDVPKKIYLKQKPRKIMRVKEKLPKQNISLNNKNERLLKKCSNFQEAVLNLQKKNNISEEQFQDLRLKAEAADLCKKSSINRKSNNNSRVPFSPNLRKFCLALNFYSPMGYRYVRRIFKKVLPHPRTLVKWYEKNDGAPGFTEEVFKVLSNKYFATGERLLCTLVVDHMAIRRQVLWDGKKSIGLVNYGLGSLETDKVASKAFVMLIVSLNQNWKLPVGYFFVDGLTAECTANLINICLSKCWDVGVDIVALTLDGCRSNINAANLLGCQLNDVENLETTFKHPSPSCNIEVAVFLDPCHMIKLIRNTFESKQLFLDGDGREIKWQFIKNLLKLQHNEKLNFGSKLIPKYIKFRNKITNIELATQLFSTNVAKTLKLCEELLNSSRFLNTVATVEFIENFNNIFNIMNSRKGDQNDFKKPICPHNKDDFFKFFDKIKHYICSLQIFVKNKRSIGGKIDIEISKQKIVQATSRTGFMGFMACIDSLKHLYNTLVENNELKYIATHRLSQNHLELLFGTIRSHGDSNKNLNVRQFQAIYRKLLGHLGLRSSFRENCIPLDNFSILTCYSAVENINRTIDRNLVAIDEDSDQNTYLCNIESDILIQNKIKVGSYARLKSIKKTQSLSTDKEAETNLEKILNIFSSKQCNLSIAEEQMVGYVSGWVARALLKTIKCEICCSVLITSERLIYHKLIPLKDMGGLCYPSCHVFEICAKSESAIKKCINENSSHSFVPERSIIQLKINIMKTFIRSDILSTLHAHSLDQPATFNHRIQLLKAIIDKYCDVRLQYLHKSR